MSVPFVRTPDDRFAAIGDWPYEPRYLDDLEGYGRLRLHYIDEGPADGPVALCLHGEPSWAYLYRKMIPPLLAAGYRVVAPDWFGFGRSDKPIDDDVYSWDFHRDTMLRFVERLDLTDITLVVQDWGGLLGLTLPVDHPDRVSNLLVMNTAFGIGSNPGKGFLAWRDYVANTPDFEVGRLMGRSIPGASEATIAAYDAPFMGAESKAGVRRFPALVPIDPDMDGVEVSRRAVAWWAEEFDGKSFMAVGMQDPVLGIPVMQWMRGVIRGCPEPLMIEDAGHFVQEHGAAIVEAALESWSA